MKVGYGMQTNELRVLLMTVTVMSTSTDQDVGQRELSRVATGMQTSVNSD